MFLQITEPVFAIITWVNLYLQLQNNHCHYNQIFIQQHQTNEVGQEKENMFFRTFVPNVFPFEGKDTMNEWLRWFSPRTMGWMAHLSHNNNNNSNNNNNTWISEWDSEFELWPAQDSPEQRGVEALWGREAALHLGHGHLVLGGGAEQGEAAGHGAEHLGGVGHHAQQGVLLEGQAQRVAFGQSNGT